MECIATAVHLGKTTQVWDSVVTHRETRQDDRALSLHADGLVWQGGGLSLRAFAAACALAALQASAVAASDTSAYAQRHELVDIGGRKLNLYCTGSGSPTVVFDAGAGLAGWDRLLVHPHIAKTNKACIYDRAGLGFSEPSGRPARRPTRPTTCTACWSQPI